MGENYNHANMVLQADKNVNVTLSGIQDSHKLFLTNVAPLLLQPILCKKELYTYLFKKAKQIAVLQPLSQTRKDDAQMLVPGHKLYIPSINSIRDRSPAPKHLELKS